MFGGIIKYQGEVKEISGDPQNGLSIRLKADLYELVDIGDSVGINGVCLTVTHKDEGLLDFDIWPESLKRTTLGDLKVGQQVHADLPLKANDYIGGHPVLGHVDYVGTVLKLEEVDSSSQIRLWIDLPPRFADLVPLRGCIALDGVSLTVTAREEQRFAVSLIPETLRMTQLGQLQENTLINIEIDCTARSLRDSENIMTLELPSESCTEAREDRLQWALENANKGGFTLIYDPETESTALSVPCKTLQQKQLGFALALSRTPCTVAVSTGLAEQLAIPAPVINGLMGDNSDRRRYLLPISHISNKLMDFSGAALLKTISLFLDEYSNLSDWKAPGNVNAVQIHGNEEATAPGVYEAAVAIALKSGLGSSALCQIMLDSDCKSYSLAQAEALATRFQLPLLQVHEIIKCNNELQTNVN